MRLCCNNLAMAITALLAGVGPGMAQQSVDVCRQGRISYVFVDNHSIFDTTDPELDPRFRWAYRTANKLHWRTRESVVRRELLFEIGDCYDPFLLSETERILRGYTFLSRVDVFGIRQEDGSVHVVVDTQDEWSTQVDLGLDFQDGVSVEVFDFRERNILGTGQSLGLFYEEREAQRNYGATFITPQLLRTRWDMRVSAGRTRAGSLFVEDITYPFLGDIGRRAFRQSYMREDQFFSYSEGVVGGTRRHVLVPIRDEAFSVAGVGRLGDRNNLTLLGAGLAFERLVYPGGSAAITEVVGGRFDDRTPADPGRVDAVDGLMDSFRRFRAVALLGQRNLRWVQRRGLDAFRGDEDVRLGVEVQVALGRTIPIADGADDWSGNATLYMANEFGPFLLAARIRADARRRLDGPDPATEDVLAGADLFAYLRPSAGSSHTLLLRASGAGGWRMRTPFQLTLGGERGVRGLHRDELPGGRRLVLSLEDRIFLGWPWPDVTDLGLTVFADAGRIWPGEAPFGVDSGWEVALGGGLRFNFPAGGGTTYRIDVAVPVVSDLRWRDLRLVVSVGEILGLGADPGDPQLVRSRRSALSGDLFHFPG